VLIVVDPGPVDVAVQRDVGRVFSIMQFVLTCSPSEAFRVEAVDEMLVEFWEQAERLSCLENSSMRIYDKILGLPFSRV
jgi:hypothetical protein